MKLKLIIKFIILFFSINYIIPCSKDDAQKLHPNEKQFIGKPLKVLLAQIAPQIKSAIENPDSKRKESNPMITFYFVDKNEFRYRNGRGETLPLTLKSEYASPLIN